MSELHEAVKNGDIDEVEKLLEGGADVNGRGVDGWTPLHEAAWYGKIETANLLIDNGADVNAKTSKGVTPANRASFWGHTEVVKILLDRGADVNSKEKDGTTALDIAKEEGHEDIVELLEAAMVQEAVKEAKEVIQDIKADNESLAMEKHHYLIRQALHDDDIEQAKSLIEKGCDINFSDHNGNTFLHHSVGHSDQDIVEHIISKGADVNAKNYAGQTPLHYTAYSNSMNASANAQSLLRNGADVSIKNNMGNTALDIAKEYERVGLLLILPSDNPEDNPEPTLSDQEPDFTHLMVRCIETGQAGMLSSLIDAVSKTSYEIPYGTLLQKTIDEAARDSFEVVLPYAIRDYQMDNL